MSQTFHCPPSDLWCFDASTPKGFYFNRGVFLFGRMVESDMAQAEAKARKNRKGSNADRLATSARLGVLAKHLRDPSIKRFRDPGKVQGAVAPDPNKPDNPFKKDQPQDERVILGKI